MVNWFKTRQGGKTRIGNTAGSGTMSTNAAGQFKKISKQMGDSNSSAKVGRALKQPKPGSSSGRG